MMRLTVFVPAVTLLGGVLFAACTRDAEPPASSGPVAGTWAVADVRFAPVSAMGADEAQAWVGKQARFSEDAAGFDEAPCSQPAYASRQETARAYFLGYNMSPQQAGLSDEDVEVVEITCNGQPWTAPAAALVKLRDGRLLAPWDGVLFVLEPAG